MGLIHTSFWGGGRNHPLLYFIGQKARVLAITKRTTSLSSLSCLRNLVYLHCPSLLSQAAVLHASWFFQSPLTPNKQQNRDAVNSFCQKHSWDSWRRKKSCEGVWFSSPHRWSHPLKQLTRSGCQWLLAWCGSLVLQSSRCIQVLGWEILS